MSETQDISKLRRRRGVAKASITRIENRDFARQMLAKLKEHDADFKRIPRTIIDLLDDNETLATEQALLDEHDDIVASLTVRIMALADSTNTTSTTKVSESELLSRRCDCLETRLTGTETALTSLTHEDVCRLEHREELLDFKKELSGINDRLLSLELNESSSLPTMVANLEKKFFDCSLHHKELSRVSATPTSTTHSEPKGVKLPKLDVPVFSGNILYWTSFWEQFCISVHDRSSLSDAEKFVYLQQALKGETASWVWCTEELSIIATDMGLLPSNGFISGIRLPLTKS